MGDNYVLSHDLVVEIHRLNLFLLKDVHRESCNNIWVDSLVLRLWGRLAVEWDQYISDLNQGNITLYVKSDKFFCAFNIKEGQVTTKLAHCSIIMNNNLIEKVK